MSEAEEEQTPEQRMAWLRAKGVQIDIPGEKYDVDPSSLIQVKVVRIPANNKEPMEELSVNVANAASAQGDQLLKALKPWFSSSGGKNDLDMEKMKDTMSKHLSANLDTDGLVSDSVFQKMLSEGNVEAFSLDKPCDENKWQGVSLYIDEASQLKSLSPNPRATQIAAQCGYIDVPLSGDVFIGRTCVNKSGPQGGSLYNDNFTLREVDSTSSWMKKAETRNYFAKAATGQIDMSNAGASNVQQEMSSGNKFDERCIKWVETPTTADITFSMNSYAKRDGNSDAIAGMSVKVFKATCCVKFSIRGITIVGKDKKVTYLEIPLNGDIDLEESTYTLNADDEGICEIEISLEKCQSGMWGSL